MEWVEHCTTSAPTASAPTAEGDFCGFVLSDGNIKDAVKMFKDKPTEAQLKYGSPEYWSTKDVTDFSYLFKDDTQFNVDISKWDTSKVTNMDRMFNKADNFNVAIGKWDTSKVKNMNAMFAGAKNFNQDISMWDLSSLEEFSTMFLNAASFNVDLCPWNNFDNLMKNPNKLDKFVSGTNCDKKATPKKANFCHACTACTIASNCSTRSCGTSECGSAKVCSYELNKENVLRVSMTSGIYGDDLSWELKESNGEVVYYISKKDLGSQMDYVYDIDVCKGPHTLCMNDSGSQYGGNTFKVTYKHTQEVIKEFVLPANVANKCETFTLVEMD